MCPQWKQREEMKGAGGDQALWGVGRLGPSLAASPAWVGDKLWILIIHAASATPVTGTEGGKGVREVGGKQGEWGN